MPFYEYECTDCKFYVEALQKISDEPLRKCPSCKRQTLKKLLSAPVFRLKGGGWYETDFKADGEDKRNLAEREEPAEAKESKPDEAGKKDDAAVKPAEPKPAESKAEVKAAKAQSKKPAGKAKPAVKVARARTKTKTVARKKARRR